MKMYNVSSILNWLLLGWIPPTSPHSHPPPSSAGKELTAAYGLPCGDLTVRQAWLNKELNQSSHPTGTAGQLCLIKIGDRTGSLSSSGLGQRRDSGHAGRWWGKAVLHHRWGWTCRPSLQTVATVSPQPSSGERVPDSEAWSCSVFALTADIQDYLYHMTVDNRTNWALCEVWFGQLRNVHLR